MSIFLAATAVPIAIAMVVAIAGFAALLPLLAVSFATAAEKRDGEPVAEREPDLAPPETATRPIAAAAVPVIRPVARTMGSVPDRELTTGRGRGLRIALAATVLVAALVSFVAPARWGGRHAARPGQVAGDSE